MTPPVAVQASVGAVHLGSPGQCATGRTRCYLAATVSKQLGHVVASLHCKAGPHHFNVGDDVFDELAVR